MSVLIETTVGDLVIDLLVKECPKSCANFLSLCRAKYYHFSRIDHVFRNKLCYMGHRYDAAEYDDRGRNRATNGQDDKGREDMCAWGLAQEAVPGPKTNRYFVPELQTSDIVAKDPKRSFRYIGTVAWVTKELSHDQELVADSKFCISLADDTTKSFSSYDSTLAVFGHVVEGQEDTLKKINEALLSIEGEPETPILILHTHILEDPFEESEEGSQEAREYKIPGLQVPESPRADGKVIRILSEVERLNDELNREEEEDEEKEERTRREREATASALTLELVGDLPSADVLPDSHVLFVCKLNSVTNSEDLELIFSRFGEIRSCEVIRDSISGDSLQYAFIEFEKKEDCERAYLKMEGAIIDDRRIHVDFSQSVSNLMGSWRKRNGVSGSEKAKGDGRYRERRDRDGGYRERRDRDGDYRERRERDGGHQERRERDGDYQKRRDRNGDYREKRERRDRDGDYQKKRDGREDYKSRNRDSKRSREREDSSRKEERLDRRYDDRERRRRRDGDYRERREEDRYRERHGRD